MEVVAGPRSTAGWWSQSRLLVPRGLRRFAVAKIVGLNGGVSQRNSTSRDYRPESVTLPWHLEQKEGELD